MSWKIIKLKISTVAFVAGVAFPIASPVMAQGYDFTPPINGLDIYLNNQNFNDAIDRVVDNAGSADEGPSVSSPAPQVAEAALTFTSSKSRTKTNIQNFVAKTGRSDPQTVDQMVMIIDQLGPMLRPMGLRTDNVADAYTVWWVAAWEAVNKKDAGSSISMYGSVKQQASNALRSVPQFASGSDALKQEMAESMLIQAAMIDAHIDAAAGNPAQQAALATAVNQGAQKMGLDLTKMDLTEQGFVPRSGKRSDAR